ncbi:MAG: metallophosphoesterase [Spirosomataceae bacterium]
MQSRRTFLKSSALALTAPLAFGQQTPAVALRFALASDGHYGQPNTDFEGFHNDLIRWMNAEKQGKGLDFVIMNGDLIHDKPELMLQVQQVFNRLPVPYYVTRGNHDHVSNQTWKQLWGYDTNHVFEKANCGFILADTSNEKGEYLCADAQWVGQQLKAFADKKWVFVIMHIPPAKWTDNGVDCAEIRNLFLNTPNFAGAFHGHEHDQDGRKTEKGKSYFFDGHIGGNWGTTYRGYRIVEVRTDGSWTTYQCNPDANPILNTYEGKAR